MCSFPMTLFPHFSFINVYALMFVLLAWNRSVLDAVEAYEITYMSS